MDFYLMDVHSTVNINGKDVAFDYINTYLDKGKAVEEAEQLSKDENVLKISVHHWVAKENGKQYIIYEDIPYYYLNENHREMKGGLL